MAEAILKLVVNKIICLIADEVRQEASLIAGVFQEIDEIRRELESMQACIRVAERIEEGDEQLATWLGQVKEAAYDVEDIIDDFSSHINRNNSVGNRVRGFFNDVFHLPGETISKHKVAVKLEKMKKRIQEISMRKNRYQIDSSKVAECSSSDDQNIDGVKWRRCSSESPFLLKETDIVGMESYKNWVLSCLTEGGHQRQSPIAIWGMGGSGKTTLAYQVYEHQPIKRHFDCFAWVTVSQSYKTETLLRSILKEFYKANMEALPADLSQLDYRNLIHALHSDLQGKRYVLVLDDVWKIDVWNDIRVAFSDGEVESRIILTTRQQDVASFIATESRILHLKPLKEQEAWRLFCRKAFWKVEGGQCPPELESLSRAIVKKCDGLPLAIVALGGLMSTRGRTKLEWQRVHDSINWHLRSNPDLGGMKSILMLSYIDLPCYLKPCFLYCSLFPEDYSIKRRRLLRLWVAEGFIEGRRGLAMEEVADEYLGELLCRGMLQVAETNEFGRVSMCRMHDILREIAQLKAEKEKFGAVYDGQDEPCGGGAAVTRRLSIHRVENYESFQALTGIPRLRSFFAFTVEVPLASIKLVLTRFRLLRVLDLQGLPIERIPDEVTDLYNLRVLNLRETKIKKLPKGIGKLTNLQVLDIYITFVEKLPKDSSKLKKLKHLSMLCLKDPTFGTYQCFGGVQAPAELLRPESLLTLDCIQATGEVLQQLAKLTRLKKLHVSNLNAADGPLLFTSLQKMERLLSLLVVAANGDEPMQLDGLSSPPPLLHKLVLFGRLDKTPGWFSLLENITRLTLIQSCIQEDPLLSLHGLPKLKHLGLYNAFKGQQLSFGRGQLLSLSKLELVDLNQLEAVTVEEGALQGLRELDIIRCAQLKKLPYGIEHIGSLRRLNLASMPEEFLDRLRANSGEDYEKVEHIPEVKHSYRKDGKLHTEYLHLGDQR